MANFFEGVGKALMHPIDEVKWMFDSTKDVLKGDMKLKDIPGSHQEMMNDITVPILGDNKLAKNSDAVAGAVIGGIMAAPLIGGAMGGASSAGGATTGALGNVSPSFSLGDIGGYFKSGANTVSNWGSDALSFLESDKSKKLKALKEAELYSDENLGYLADMEDEAGGAVKAGLGKGEDALKAAQSERTPMDFDKMSKVLQSIKMDEEPTMPIQQARASGFRYDPKSLENPLVAREYQQMYMAPLYKNLM